jgi:hypothetical protein
MNSFQKNIYSNSFETFSGAVLESGSISSISRATSGIVCSELLDTICYFDTSINGAINSGDIAYTNELGTIPVVGGNQYYKVSLINIHSVLISDTGVITLDTLCL